MNTAAAAELLEVSTATLRAWAAANLVPCRIIEHRGKRTYLFDRATLTKWKGGEEPAKVTPRPNWEAVS
jgi:DNA-binding transcriptional MerR regulator